MKTKILFLVLIITFLGCSKEEDNDYKLIAGKWFMENITENYTVVLQFTKDLKLTITITHTKGYEYLEASDLEYRLENNTILFPDGPRVRYKLEPSILYIYDDTGSSYEFLKVR